MLDPKLRGCDDGKTLVDQTISFHWGAVTHSLDEWLLPSQHSNFTN
ncbi:MAG: hypothetical protein WAZ12_02905 [Candidatus Absconditicoccaceae bacterium]